MNIVNLFKYNFVSHFIVQTVFLISNVRGTPSLIFDSSPALFYDLFLHFSFQILLYLLTFFISRFTFFVYRIEVEWIICGQILINFLIFLNGYYYFEVNANVF
jgi:hypothetical protein